MNERNVDKNRRRALKLAASSVVAIPFGGMLAGAAFAEDLPAVAADDPQGIALKYVADATTAERADKSGTPGADQTCANCQLSTPGDGDQLPCSLFPGKSVAKGGWCSAWAKRA
jgi:hypothetical protein